MQIGQHLFTKDGRIIGNAIITETKQDPELGILCRFQTDFGNGQSWLTQREITNWWWTERDGEPVISDLTRWLQDRAEKINQSALDPQPLRAGDEVRHTPSGEEWTLATDEENNYVAACGWPNTMAKSSDCVLLKPATDEERLTMLKTWAATGKGSEHERDSRTLTARRQLQQESTLAKERRDLAHEVYRATGNPNDLSELILASETLISQPCLAIAKSLSEHSESQENNHTPTEDQP